MQFIETFIGLSFVYFLGSILTSALNEALAFFLNSRGKTLKEAIQVLFSAPFATTFYLHTLTKQLHGHNLLGKVSQREPSYLTAQHFATVTLDILFSPKTEEDNTFLNTFLTKLGGFKEDDFKENARKYLTDSLNEKPNTFSIQLVYRLLTLLAEPKLKLANFQAKVTEMKDTYLEAQGVKDIFDATNTANFEALKDLISLVPEKELQVFIKTLAKSCKTIKELEEKLQNYFNDYMDRVSGWYKRKMQLMITCISFVFCFALNIDTIQITQTLWSNEAMRTSIANVAEDYYEQHTQDSTHTLKDSTATANFKQELKTIHNTIEEYNQLPFGWKMSEWKAMNPNTSSFWLKMLGFALSCLALSLGAPFWFDVLGKMINLRVTGKKPEN